MRRIRYSVAMSLDGYIAGPKGESDWIIMDPEIDFGSLFNQFDAVLMGRKTFEAARKHGGSGGMPGMEAYVFSRTLRQKDHPDVTVVADKAKETLTALKKGCGGPCLCNLHFLQNKLPPGALRFEVAPRGQVSSGRHKIEPA